MDRDECGQVARAFRITGRVQGVGFRWWTRRAADELGVTGGVWNRPDGSVEVQARGPVRAVDRLEELLRQGPPTARVREVTELCPPPKINRNGFYIQR